ncbi:MAG: insulinase family protein [Planctomycetes bacterium]|nr:insulinase family protein [Planctomycetota bacterium]
MRKLSVLSACAVLLLPLLVAALAQEKPPAPRPALDVSEHVLDNGLKVLVVNKPGVPVVNSFVWYKVGSMDEQPGITGIAHFLEHMMFKGSREYKVGDVDRVTVRNGGSNNAFTSYDYTAYYIDLPKGRWREAMKIEADRMAHLTLDLKEFDSEKKVVQSESDIAADDPGQRLWQRMSTAMYGRSHPYGHPVLGWPQDVQDTTRRDMRLFYERHYHPNHATLVLCGDITSAEALPVVKELFGPIPRGPELNRPKPAPVNFRGPVVLEERGDSPVVQFTRSYVGVAAGHADEPALDVLGLILGGGPTSRLYRKLVDETGVALEIGAGSGSNMLAGEFYLWGVLNPESDRRQLEYAVQLQIDALAKDGVTPEELERARNRYIAASVFERESASSVAQALGRAETVLGDWRAALTYPDRIRAVTAADVQRVARQYLTRERSVTGWLVPELSATADQSVPDAAPGALPVRRHVLSNGLIVLLLPRPGLPVISASAGVRAPRAAETAAECGLANFTGRLLDCGTENFSKQRMAESVEAVGGELSFHAAGGGFRVLSEHAPLGLRLLAEGLLRPQFPPQEVELARKQILAGMESSKDDTGWFARNAAAAALWGPDQPLGRPAEGTPESVRALTREQVVQWHRRWFRPDNCVLAVVGHFDEKTMLAAIEAEFAAWPRPSDALRLPEAKFAAPGKREGTQAFTFQDFRPENVRPSARRVTIDHPKKDQVVVRLSGPGITRADPDYIPLLVMDNILGTSPGFTDRFSRVLRDQMGLAYSAYANITSGSGLYPGQFLGYIGTRPGNVEPALARMYELIAEIREQPVSEDELRGAKDYLKGSFVFGLETTGQLAGLLIEIERFNLGWDYLVRFNQSVEAVTVEDIRRVARKHLVPENMVEVLAGPIAKIGTQEEEPGQDE